MMNDSYSMLCAWCDPQYYMECAATRPAGHFHPDLTLGRCLGYLSAEEVRMFYGSDWTQPHKLEYVKKHRPMDVRCQVGDHGETRDCQRVGTVESRVVGPVGWHMMSFMSRCEPSFWSSGVLPVWNVALFSD